MLIDNICNYYYKEAINCAKNNDVSHALYFLRKIPNSCSFNDEVDKLTSLCLFRLGCYSSCLKKAVNNPEYEGIFKQALKDYEEYFKMLIEKLKNKEYKSALKILLQHSKGSVLEYNMLGSIYVLCSDIKNARLSFYKALELDIYNDKTMYLILSLKGKNETNFFLQFLKNLFSKR